ncbi:MAG: hypothetical protein M3R02_29000, partial [Chloroflexota bacterium]|nr:hypothetical protein [Chloroflexota bacterium]
SMTASYAERLTAERPGGVLFVAPNVGPIEDLAPFVQAIRQSNSAFPPLIAVDQEGGPVTRIPGDPNPGAVELGQEQDAAVRQVARDRAAYLRSFGFDINFSPVADVAHSPNSVMVDRSFGDDPALVAEKVAATVDGMNETRLIGAAKHFPGHGRTPQDSHAAIPEVDISPDEWRKTDALPFRAAIEAGVGSVMLGHLRYGRWDDLPASMSKVAVEVLRRELGFDGVVVTDDLGMGALVEWDPFEVVDRALAADIDLLLYADPPAPPLDLVNHVRARIERGEIPEARIDASLRRLARLRARE